ncbi:MAG: SMP-30/gluconolactonase/LRE family protein [Gaiellaceae bacterium]
MRSIRLRVAVVVGVAVATGFALTSAFSTAAKPPSAGDASWTTVFRSTLPIEGLTGDADGNLYVVQRGGAAGCPVQRLAADGGAPVLVGQAAPPCGPSGLTFDAAGRLYLTGLGAQSDQIGVLTPNAAAPPTATVFATGVPGANGLAFDRDGNLWTGDGTTGFGRVWRIPPTGGAGMEMFRVQPMANDVTGGVGRDVRSLPPGTISPTTRMATNTLGSQPLVANGVAFAQDGSLLIADTARGALWRVELDEHGNVLSPTGCDTTFVADTLCLENVWVQHPALEGADGIALDRAGNVWVAANERNAIAVVDRQGRVEEFFRSPPTPAQVRNQGPLEFPTSPFLADRTLCITQSDGSRRDNFPNSGGQVGPGTGFAAKVSCLEERLQVPGLPLPVG